MDGGQEGTTRSVVCILALMVSKNVFKRSVTIDLLFSDESIKCMDHIIDQSEKVRENSKVLQSDLVKKVSVRYSGSALPGRLNWYSFCHSHTHHNEFTPR